MSVIRNIKNSVKKSNLLYVYYRLKNNMEFKEQKRLAQSIIAINNKLKALNCHFIFVRPPESSKLDILSKEDIERIKNWTFDFNHIDEKDAEKLKKIYQDSVEVSDIIKMYDGAKVIEADGHKTLADFSNEYVHIISGRRVTAYLPNSYKNTVHIYGACTVRGTGVRDEETISSYLQDLLNKNAAGRFSCQNHGIGCGSSVYDDIYSIETSILKEGDIIVLCNLIEDITERDLLKAKIPYIQSSDEFNKQKITQVWFSDLPVHTNRIGNRVIADSIFNDYRIKEWLFNCGKEDGKLLGRISDNSKASKWAMTDDFKTYINELKIIKRENSVKNGAIVMNCNPFTLGHRYLIETASKMVDTLYIFVVEENKSFFSFEDRRKLVEEGTKDIDNVVVTRSGKFIISALTFPGYFYKENDKTAIVDTSQDIELFAKYIAPVLDISVRFAGEEPIDMVTRQYNDMMRSILPLYNISFNEIKRKKEAEEVISASKVRNAMKMNDWNYIKKVVPTTTYNYLIGK